MPTKVGIHAFYKRKQSHGWREACARDDGCPALPMGQHQVQLAKYQPALLQTLRLTPSVMPTKVGIHAFYKRKQSHGWREACARDDGCPAPPMGQHQGRSV
jgi:hypothetical protein